MLARLLAEILDKHPEGCCLHVVYVDENWDDESVAGAVAEAYRRRHANCAAVAEAWRAVPQRERRRLLPRP